MSKSIAILYVPEQTEESVASLALRFRNVLKLLDADPGEMVCCSQALDITHTLTHAAFETLVVGWGHIERPNWGDWFARHLNTHQARHVLVFYLRDADWPSAFPLRSARERRSGRPQVFGNDTMFDVFTEGGHIATQIPFGFQQAAGLDSRRRIVAESEEATIVRLIFDLFVSCDHSRPVIATLLNAQGVKPPRNNAKWTAFKIDTILADPIYIGTSRYKSFLRQNTFETLVDPALFYAAQVKILTENHKHDDVINVPKHIVSAVPPNAGPER